jgi:hypothetical protein
MDLTGFRRMGQKLVAPLIVLGLADLMLVAELSDGLAFRPSMTIIALVLASHLRRCMADLLSCQPQYTQFLGPLS